jgi:hypothetical protein
MSSAVGKTTMMIPRISIQLLVATLLLAQGSKPNLSGRWEVNKSLSTAKTTFVKHPELSGPPAPVPPADHAFDTMRPQTITHSEPSLVIVDEPILDLPRLSLKLSTDGKENINEFPDRGLHRSSTRWDGSQLVTEWVLEHDGSPTMRGLDRRSMSNGGSVLLDERTVLTPFHETRFHIVWVRKNS